VHQLFDRLAER